MVSTEQETELEDSKLYRCFGDEYTGLQLKAFKEWYYNLTEQQREEWATREFDRAESEMFPNRIWLNDAKGIRAFIHPNEIIVRNFDEATEKTYSYTKAKLHEVINTIIEENQ